MLQRNGLLHCNIPPKKLMVWKVQHRPREVGTMDMEDTSSMMIPLHAFTELETEWQSSPYPIRAVWDFCIPPPPYPLTNQSNRGLSVPQPLQCLLCNPPQGTLNAGVEDFSSKADCSPLSLSIRLPIDSSQRPSQNHSPHQPCSP